MQNFGMNYTYWEMLKEMLQIGLPAGFSLAFVTLIESINFYYIGNYGIASMLAGIGMANMFINIIFIAFIVGINAVMGTLMQQAYNFGNMHLVGIYLNKARIVSILVTFPLAFLASYAETVFLLLDMDKEVAGYAQIYVTLMTPGLFAFGQFDANRNFLNQVNKRHIPIIVSLIACLSHIVWCHFFIYKLNLDVAGAAYATCLTYLIMMALIMIMATFHEDISNAWFFPGLESFMGLLDFLALAVPQGFILCVEFWAFESITFMSGFLSVTENAAQVIIMNAVFILFSFPLGASIASCQILEEHLLEGRLEFARRFRGFAQGYGLAQSVIVSLLLVCLRGWVAWMFTPIQEVKEVIKETMLMIVWIASLFDQTQTIQLGVLRGMGYPKGGIMGSTLVYYLISVPLGALLCFWVDLHLYGLWLGLAIALAFLSLILQVLISFCYSWEECEWMIQTNHKKVKFAQHRRQLLESHSQITQ